MTMHIYSYLPESTATGVIVIVFENQHCLSSFDCCLKKWIQVPVSPAVWI